MESGETLERPDDIAGIDGCKAGWIVATDQRCRRAFRRLRLEPFVCDRHRHADRACATDRHARATPRPASTSACRKFGVSRTPPRACLDLHRLRNRRWPRRVRDRPRHLHADVQHHAEGPRARSADRPGESSTFVEVHPECAFMVMNGDENLPSKRTSDGRAIRRAVCSLFISTVPPAAPRARRSTTCSTPTPCCGARTASERGEHRVFGDGSVDARGARDAHRLLNVDRPDLNRRARR